MSNSYSRGGANASSCDPLDRRLLQVHEVDVVPVVRLVVTRLQRYTLHTETVILGISFSASTGSSLASGSCRR